MGWIAVCAALAACGDQPRARGSSRSMVVSSSEDPIRQAADAREKIRRGTLPAYTDRIVARLDALRGTRNEREAAVAAAQLLDERYRRFHDGRDLLAAEQRWRALASGQDSVACDALARLGSLELRADDRDGARSAWIEYVRRCPDGAAIEHVRASLALLDPAMARAATPAAQQQQRPLDGTAQRRRPVSRVVIDAGHGGSDPGARGPSGLRESDVTLEVSRRVAERLALEHGIDVVMTRDRDVYVSLEERAQRANAARADLFVSIHCNAAPRVEARGVSVYALDAQHERVESRFARRVRIEHELDPLDDVEVAQILADLQLATQGARSWRLAARVQRSLLTTLRASYPDVEDMGVHAARFNVLVGTEMPAILVELSFISNPMEESRLRDERYQNHLARAIADAVAQGPG